MLHNVISDKQLFFVIDTTAIRHLQRIYVAKVAVF